MAGEALSTDAPMEQYLDIATTQLCRVHSRIYDIMVKIGVPVEAAGELRKGPETMLDKTKAISESLSILESSLMKIENVLYTTSGSQTRSTN